MKYCIRKNTDAYFQGMTDNHYPMFGPLNQAAVFATNPTAQNVIKEYKLDGCYVMEINC